MTGDREELLVSAAAWVVAIAVVVCLLAFASCIEPKPAAAVTLHSRLVVPRERLLARPTAAWAESLRVCGGVGHPLTVPVTVRWGIPGAAPWRNDRRAPGDTIAVVATVRAPAYGRTDVYWLTAWAIPDTGAVSCAFARRVSVRWDSVVTWR